MDSSVKICGEVELRIHQHFMIGPNTNKDNITRVYSHAQSLAQCRKWLDSNYPNIERVAVSSNAEAARRVKGEWNSAAMPAICPAISTSWKNSGKISKIARITRHAS